MMLERLGLERELFDLGLRTSVAARNDVEHESSDPFAQFTPSELRALRYTSTLETGRELGFDGLTGDFDGYGISFGLINWNIGAGSLQPLFREFIKAHPDRWKAVFGSDAARFEEVLFAKEGSEDANIAKQLAFVREHMTVGRTKTVREPWAGYFHALAREPGFQKIQTGKIRTTLARAVYWCDYFNLRSDRALVFMFDLVSSNGGAWLDRKGSNRRALLRSAMEEKKTARKRELSEIELMLEIADVMGRTVKKEYARNARMRKRMIALGGMYKCVSVPGLGINDEPFTTYVKTRELEKLAKQMPARPFVSPPPPDAPYPEDWKCSGSKPQKPAAPPKAPSTSSLPPAPSASSPPAPRPASSSTVETGFVLPAGVTIDHPEVRRAVAELGTADPNALASKVFYALHPERNGRKIDAQRERGALAEWWTLREGPIGHLIAVSNAKKKRADYMAEGAIVSPASIVSRHGLNPWTIKRPRQGQVANMPDVRQIIVHTTSGGPARLARQAKHKVTAIDWVLRYYGGIRKASAGKKQDGFPHYVIHYDGAIFATYDERFAAIHAGYATSERQKPLPSWWTDAWKKKGQATPMTLHEGYGSPNSASIGIELLADTSGWGFTDGQYAVLARLVRDIARRYHLGLSELPSKVVLGHEDVAPWSRTTGGVPWDPGAHTRGKFSWSRLDAEIRALT